MALKIALKIALGISLDKSLVTSHIAKESGGSLGGAVFSFGGNIGSCLPVLWRLDSVALLCFALLLSTPQLPAHQPRLWRRSYLGGVKISKRFAKAVFQDGPFQEGTQYAI